MALTAEHLGLLEQSLSSEVRQQIRLGGGDFADSSKVTLADGRTVFVKTHSNPPDGFFSTEAAGLDWLRDSDTVNVPFVLLVSDSPPLLVLEWIEEGGAQADTEVTLGRELAALHRLPFACFGRPDERTTGSQALPNIPCHSWPEFYAERRLLPLARIARDTGVLNAGQIAAIEKLASRLDSFDAADDPAALLHGDLWAGNRLVDTSGRSWLIDPAAQGGHREFDLAMMRLFGGYSERCFASYQESFSLHDGWQQRVALHQLAPLIVHAVKFGGHYVAAVSDVLGQYK